MSSKMSSPQRILLIGGGAYVSGRGGNGYGTIGPALMEAVRRGQVNEIAIATTRTETAVEARDRLLELAGLMSITPPKIETWPRSEKSSNTLRESNQHYLAAIQDFKPDGAIISVPDHMHFTVARDVLMHDVHCLMVKPFVPNVAEARELTLLAKERRLIAQVEFHKRLDEANLLLRKSLVDKEIGEPLYAVIEYSQRKKVPMEWFRGWAAKSNIFQYLGVHYVDLLYFLTGFTPLRVTAYGQKEFLTKHGIDTWDAMQVAVEWRKPNGNAFVSTHMTNWIDPDQSSAMSDQRICIVGTTGRLESDQKNRGMQKVLDRQGVLDVNPYFTVSLFENGDADKLRFQGYGIASILQFVNDLENFTKRFADYQKIEFSRPSFASSTVSTAVLEAARTSLLNNSRACQVEGLSL